ncbi:ParB family chromosome partitioning protein [Agrobacterium vitis]|nr:ParB family chromosome partitioning protein [Agrobacterium vitis]MBE1437894.1 ParB family chromosome partitioning protein [Agrobacterium vitis]
MPAGPIKSMALTLGKMEEEANALKQALGTGQIVRELEPDLVDPSFMRDRMDEIAFSDDDVFLRSIAENGQEVPILVRPHPDHGGRYQVAYGHRRLKAAAQLGIKVKAIVRDFDDTALIVAQGLENSGRESLSFIERAVFAYGLEQRGFKRRDIGLALSTDKTELSKLISVPLTIPLSIIKAIGSAKGIGRRKWLALVSVYNDDRQQEIERFLFSRESQSKPSDQRFEAVYVRLADGAKSSNTLEEWSPRAGGELAGNIKMTAKKFSLTLTNREAAGFGQFLSEKLDEIYEDYRRQQGD